MTNPIGLREKKKIETRALLIRTAIKLFLKRGFDAVTIDDICAACDVSPRTFFRYFAAKENIVLYDLQIYKDAFTQVLSTANANEPYWQTAQRAALAVAKEIVLHSDDLRPRLMMIGQSPLLIATWTELDRFWRDGLLALFTANQVKDADLVAGGIVGALNAALTRFLIDPSQNPEVLTSRVFELFSV